VKGHIQGFVIDPQQCARLTDTIHYLIIYRMKNPKIIADDLVNEVKSNTHTQWKTNSGNKPGAMIRGTICE
jgi:hypothetical protein